ncbi:MAG: M24 family metallopeptidase, partial [Bacillota bacterium]|nr:M24 family metallopeptidase [Bacillota bacterium]
MPGDWLHALLLTASRAVVILPRMTTIFGDPTAGKPWRDEVVVLDESPALAAPVYRIIRCLGLERGIWGVSKKTPAVTLLRLGQEFPGLGFAEAEPLLSRLRQVKDPVAVQIMRRACEVTDRVFASVLGQVQYGMSGREVAELVDRQARVMGAQGMSFPTGVMVGGCPSPASSFGSGCTLAFDFGLVVDGYCSDFGRTVYVGEPDGERLRMHRAVLEAQQAGMTALRPGARAWEVDRAARRVLESYGWGHLTATSSGRRTWSWLPPREGRASPVLHGTRSWSSLVAFPEGSLPIHFSVGFEHYLVLFAGGLVADVAVAHVFGHRLRVALFGRP